MAQIQRLKDPEISEGNFIIAEDIDAELNQLVSEANNKDLRITAIESGNVSLMGTKTFTGTIRTSTITDLGSGVSTGGVVSKNGIITPIPTTQPFVPSGNGQFGYDSTNHQYRGFRNGSNLSFLMTGDNIVSVTASTKTTAYTALTTDRGNLFRASSAWTFVTTAATLGAGWYAFFKNEGTGNITFDPNASETINGVTSIIAGPKSEFMLVCDGSGFYTMGRLRYEGTQSITSGGSWTLTHNLGDTPSQILFFIKCNSAELNYSAGDLVPVANDNSYSTNNTGAGAYVTSANTTSISGRFGSSTGAFVIGDKTTGGKNSITDSKWDLIVRAEV